MDKNILVQYSAMKEEIKDIRRRIEKDRKELDRLNKLVVSDSVTCGKKGKKPIRTVKIQGRPVAAISRKESALKKHIYQLEQKEAELMELLKSSEGNDQVIIYLKKERAKKMLPPNWNVMADAGLLNRLYCKVGEKNVKVLEKSIEK